MTSFNLPFLIEALEVESSIPLKLRFQFQRLLLDGSTTLKIILLPDTLVQ